MKDKLYALQQKVLHVPLLYWLVVLICLGGTVYGFFWYKEQLAQTPLLFWIFTPDCPGAVFLFLIWLILRRMHWPEETFRVITVTALIKYGIWTVSVIGLFWIDRHLFYWDNIMLFSSHAGMLLLGIVFAQRMKITGRGFAITSIWLIINDIADYVFNVHPWLPDNARLEEIRTGTFILTVLLVGWMLISYLRYRAARGASAKAYVNSNNGLQGRK